MFSSLSLSLSLSGSHSRVNPARGRNYRGSNREKERKRERGLVSCGGTLGRKFVGGLFLKFQLKADARVDGGEGLPYRITDLGENCTVSVRPFQKERERERISPADGSPETRLLIEFIPMAFLRVTCEPRTRNK